MKRFLPLPSCLATAALGLATLLPLGSQAADFSEASRLVDLKDPEVLAYVNLQHDFKTLGDWLGRVHRAVLQANPSAPPIPVDYQALFADLGLAEMHYALLASERAADVPGTFLNQLLLELGTNPTGLFAIMGTENRPFDFAGRVPGDTDAVSQFQLNGDAILQFARLTATRIMGATGQSLIDAQMQAPLYPEGPTAARLIELLSTTYYSASNLDPERFADSTDLSLAQLTGDFAYVVENAAELPGLVAPLLPPSANFSKVENDPHNAYRIPFEFTPDSQQFLYFSHLPESDHLLITNSLEARAWFLADDSGITDNPDFQRMSSQLPDQGLFFNFSSAKASRHAMKLVESALRQTPDMPPQAQPFVGLFLEALQSFTGPNMSVLVRDESRLHLRNLAPYSQKTSLAIAGAVVPGIAAAIAIPAFQKVQEASTEKAVTNNLRQLAAASQQYFLETGESSVMAEDLIGPEAYIPQLQSVAGESYQNILISADETTLSVTLPDGSVISYSF